MALVAYVLYSTFDLIPYLFQFEVFAMVMTLSITSAEICLDNLLLCESTLGDPK